MRPVMVPRGKRGSYILGFEYSTKVLVLVLKYSCKNEYLYLYLYSWHHQVIVLGLEYNKMYLNPSLGGKRGGGREEGASDRGDTHS